MGGCRAAAAGALRLTAFCTRTQRPLWPGAGTGASVWARRSLSEPAALEPRRRLKTAAELPGPSWFTTLYWLSIRGYGARGHLLQCLQKRRYGPMWRSRFGPFQLVNVASPRLIAQVIQQEGRYPVRVELPHWKEYRDLRGQAYGLHVESGPEWHRIRSVLNPKMLRPREVSVFAPVVQSVVDDLLARLELLRRRSPDGATVPDLAAELYKFGFEGISAVLFETRLGCLQEEIPTDTLRFITAVNDMLTLSDLVVLLPRWSRRLLPFWRRFVQAWDDLYGVAQKLVDQRMAELAAQPGNGGGGEGMYLTYLLSSDRLSRAEVYISVTELMLGGVDTTSNTLSWALYHLARDRPAQNRLQAEVDSVCPDRRPPSTQQLGRMPYLRAVIKETLRLYPVVHGNGRLVSENEVVVDEFWFPKKVRGERGDAFVCLSSSCSPICLSVPLQTQFHLCHYAASHDEEEFVAPEEFLPQRWLQLESPSSHCGRATPGFYRHHPYSFIPFGVGVRACVGKRLAEMEMHLALSRLMQHYDVHPEVGSPLIEPKTRTLLIPSRPINLRFLPRA
ncbi:PREDICTED: sterol 26-hydroxylase, mitochondrial-like isoform X1 [Poecilia mexicana]|uniref:sterol 26-hydroxylase, mitochondrial-like isoform X1 n=1 Tax=Poecilia mexicana TaxID=48701 RepID=UPI00072D92ED|nr:PREDICTED: sterol 26-hydroxylase, mitochondrial-like isoform X1 [Poecilia mexicana]